jgi:peptide/nickel transport system ATP-binding protein
VLSVRDLVLEYKLRRSRARAVDSVSFDVDRGQTLGLVGESGCGKTTLALSLLRLLPRNADVVGGQVCLGGRDVLQLPEAEMRRVRWREISMIFQGAMNALNPVFRVSDQLVEAIRQHESVSDAAARARGAQLFEMVGLPATRMNQFPHEFSGGMKQRAVIAMALACRPSVVVADEPTTALDVVVQDQVLQTLQDIQRELDLAVMIISHDISVVAESANQIAVMYAGQIVETGPTETVFADPRHPYTIGLLRSFPSLRGPARRLVSIPGSPPNLAEPPTGCRFAPRCPLAQPICHNVAPELLKIQDSPEQSARCHFANQPPLLATLEFDPEGVAV